MAKSGIRFLTKIKCLIFGHNPELRIHPVPKLNKPSVYQARDFEYRQVVCNRCLKDFGKKRFWRHERQEFMESWLEEILPRRNRKRLMRKAKKLGLV